MDVGTIQGQHRPAAESSDDVSGLWHRIASKIRPARPQAPHAHENYIHPKWLPPGYDLTGAALDVLWELIAEASVWYAHLMDELFGIQLEPHQVVASLHSIELNWDAVCPIARFAPSGFRDAWNATFHAASVTLGLSEHDAEPIKLDLSFCCTTAFSKPATTTISRS